MSTLNDSLPVWDLGVSPTSPQYKGFITVNPSDSELHEMYVKSTGSTSSKVYASALRGGLHVIDFSDLQNLSFTVTTQSYHSDNNMLIRSFQMIRCSILASHTAPGQTLMDHIYLQRMN